VKNVILWTLRERDKEVGPGEHGKRLWTLDKDVSDLHIKCE